MNKSMIRIATIAALLALVFVPAALAGNGGMHATATEAPANGHPVARVMQDMSKMVASWRNRLDSGRPLGTDEVHHLADQMQEMSGMMNEMSAMMTGQQAERGGMMMGGGSMMMSQSMRERMTKMHERMQEMMRHAKS